MCRPTRASTTASTKPLLGWQSQLTKKWLAKGGTLVDPRIKRILDGRITPGPESVINPHPLEFLAQPLEPGAGKIAVYRC